MQYRTLETEAAVTLDPRGATGTVIWLHGLGADGHDFVPMIPQLTLPASAPTRFVFPHARVRPVTINNGYPMRAWYDIRSLTTHGRGDLAGIADSVATVHSLVAAEQAAGIPAHRIVIAGFSQGGAVAMHAGLTAPVRLGGIIAASTYLPCAGELDLRLAAGDRDLPVLMCHGNLDNVVAPELGREARDWLVARGFAVQWHEYPMAHEICAEEIADVSRWLRDRLA